MSKKKKKAEMQQAPVQQAPMQRQMPPMGMPGYFPYPVAPASQIVQLPPIVQPIVMVPFASQQQPLATFEEEDDDFDF